MVPICWYLHTLGYGYQTICSYSLNDHFHFSILFPEALFVYEDIKEEELEQLARINKLPKIIKSKRNLFNDNHEANSPTCSLPNDNSAANKSDECQLITEEERLGIFI